MQLGTVLDRVGIMANVRIQKAGHTAKEKNKKALEEMKFNITTNAFQGGSESVQTYAAITVSSKILKSL